MRSLIRAVLEPFYTLMLFCRDRAGLAPIFLHLNCESLTFGRDVIFNVSISRNFVTLASFNLDILLKKRFRI